MNTPLKKSLTVLAYIAMVAVNYLAVALPLAGKSTAAVSDSYPNLFAPAGFTFAIWGVIYLLLGAYVVYQTTRTDDNTVATVNNWFLLNAVLNATWMFSWHYEVIWLSVLLMLGILGTLIVIAEKLRASKLTKKEKWLVQIPFSVYFGWITVATIANITVLLVALNWNGFGIAASTWMVVVLLVGALIGILRMLRDSVAAYGLVLVWAYYGILSKHLSVTGFAGTHKNVIYTAMVAMMMFVVVIGYVSLIPRKTQDK